MANTIQNFGFVTPEQVADALQVSSRTIRNWISSGRLRATRPGGSRYLIARADLDALLRDSLTQPPPPAPDLAGHVLSLDNVTEQQDSDPTLSPLTNRKKNGRKS